MEMKMGDKVLDELFTYAVKIRRKLHEYPEIGFELDRTVALVSKELEKMGITYTYKYGKSSIVADLGQGDKLIAIRADMDALPVEEKTDVPFQSKIKGAMHACGHDSHTGVLLAVARFLKENEARLHCRIRLIFQPSEEGAVSGAKMMVQNGVMEGVDYILGVHAQNEHRAGMIGTCTGNYAAACVPLTIRFKGKTSHATIPQLGVDAIAMAVMAYGEMQTAVKEEADGLPYIWSVGRFSGGHVHNVIADKCELDISFRFYDSDFADRTEKRIRKICADIAEKFGGSAEIDWNMSTGAVRNDETITAAFVKALEENHICHTDIKSNMSSEDFAWYLTNTPGMYFVFGTRNESTGCTALAHTNNFKIDETGMKTAINAFISYILKVGKGDASL